MTAQLDLKQVREYVISILPQLLREEPDILTSIEGIIAQQFPRREEFTHLVEEVIHLAKEIKLQGETTNQRFELLEQNYELLHKEMNHGFEQVDQRFEQMDKRFAQMDRRIDLLHEEINHRFEKVDERFEQMDRRIDLLQEEMNHRFEQVDKRIDLLHEEMNRRFEQVDERIDLLHEEMNLRFDKMHREQLDLKRRVIKVESSVDKVLDKMEKFDAWLKVISGDQGTEKGQTLEDLFALALQYGLKNPDIKPETIQLRQELFDPKGQVFLRKNFATEIDLIAEDGHLTVFEIKATADKDDVNLFAMKVQLVQLQNPDQQVKGVFISPGMGDAVIQRCIDNELEFLA